MQSDIARRILAPTPFQPPCYDLLVQSYALELVAETILRLAGQGGGGPEHIINGRERVRLCTAIDFLASHDGDALRLEDVAREAGTSVSTLQRLFRAVHGTTVGEFYRRIRLDRARRLLEQDRVSVTEAAFAAGYSNPANFATAFKRRFGVPPRTLRRPGFSSTQV